ncbi:Probable 39S ribosomal protein L49, mitochondrial [Eumeta japonica]|uniref:Large ribosomal subunit protein mL49 n=1 Tax=Eumeta variegata TaxID=151549 RepID=A0A4C1WP69_EUMVA|nr:Probable 39S ribosomal protein L49, mitochondrial [Eumeta japonica]
MAAVWRSCGPFLKGFAGKTSQIPNNAADFIGRLRPVPVLILPVNYSSYAKSPFVYKIEERYNYDVVKKPIEWKYVERLLPFETIPNPLIKDKYPSGWVPPKEEAKELPYFIHRSKNHFLPVYLKISLRGSKKISIIRKIDGDIWLLNDELKKFLKDKNKMYVETRVHELAQFIEVKGDYVIDIRNWALSKGF